MERFNQSCKFLPEYYLTETKIDLNLTGAIKYNGETDHPLIKNEIDLPLDFISGRRALRVQDDQFIAVLGIERFDILNFLQISTVFKIRQ